MRTFVDLLGALSEKIEVQGTLQICRDPDDDLVLETAVRGSADVLVSRDEDVTRVPELVTALEHAGIRVMTVARFLDQIGRGL